MMLRLVTAQTTRATTDAVSHWNRGFLTLQWNADIIPSSDGVSGVGPNSGGDFRFYHSSKLIFLKTLTFAFNMVGHVC